LIEIKKTPIKEISFRGRSFFLKLDYLNDPHFSGNKARKLYYYLKRDFPHIKKVISCGSIQSNAMYSLSYLAKIKNWEFEYYVKHIPSYLRDNPHGNYQKALDNGMKLRVGDYPKTFCEDELFIKEGGAGKAASEGIKILADEINEEFKDEDICIFLPSGTGTTALYLQQYLKHRVYTTPVVGTKEYLMEQFEALEPNLKIYPTVLETKKRYYFGKLYKEFLQIWIELNKSSKVEFDLLYDPKGWLALLENIESIDSKILYLHQGGLFGNESMIRRYEREFDEYFR
jgi:1-aminocyclopropane-1-carboxylate deaminase/D-cysteine desulfhydrase-like pyridoxal-dependent ACC family enzyme